MNLAESEKDRNKKLQYMKKMEGIKLMQKVKRGIKDLLEFKQDNNCKDFQT